MRNETRLKFDAYLGRIGEIHGVNDTSKNFSVDPSVQQRLIDKRQESIGFLGKINIVPVPELKGEIIGLSVGNPIAGRTDTSGNGERTTTDPSGLDNRGFECFQTNFDTHLTYAKLDMWAKFDDFQQRIANQIAIAIGLDNIRIGWNGESVAATTNKANFPMLQDVNKGWLKKLDEEAPAQFMKQGAEANKVTYGDGGDYATLDALVYDMVNSLLPPWASEDPELVVMVSRDLLHDKYFPMINAAIDPTEQLARDVIMSTKRLGGLPATRIPFMPAGTIAITRFDNLSIYEQEGKQRRHIIENPRKNRVEDFRSSNDAYVIEDLDFMCAAKNIQAVEED
ncbi:phage major capsid protein, P2 family [Sphingobium sp. B11D3D]|uniref:phage major capsid protein, P2 family n=1 Tax=Sphingobium sp. B11D3D TaxID=2940576 RepID=UPI002224124F|nr:phage major capsid protein, P2 family [Sphingobium sp. B11D3D]MCW2370215.1 P2 family phage major capsid protein [Sphingobium sp. B11D3D]